MTKFIDQNYKYIEQIIDKQTQERLKNYIFYAKETTFHFSQYTSWSNIERMNKSLQGQDHLLPFIDKAKEHPQFYHVFYGKNDNLKDIYQTESAVECLQVFKRLESLQPLFLRDFQLYRGKINITTVQPNYPKNNFSGPHIDTDDDNFWSLIYYINDSDGDTHLFLRDRTVKSFTPRQGSALLFKSNIYHSGSPPHLSTNRAILNFVFRCQQQPIHFS